MNSILERIAKHKLEEVAVAKKNKPLHVLSKQQPGEIRDFIAALKSNTSPAVIAEIKKASPSKGLIRKDF